MAGYLVAAEVMKVSRDSSNRLDPSSKVEFQDENLDIDTGSPIKYYMNEDYSIVFGPIPDAIETLIAKVILKPADDADYLPDALYKWRKAIAAGARIWVRENYDTWINDTEQAKDRMLFDEAVTEALCTRSKGNTRHKLRAKAYFS
jgi:hypothetical protein